MDTKEKQISWWDGIKEVIKFSIKPTFGHLFHPIYTMVNAAVCGSLGEVYLGGFGLGSLTLGIMAISIGTMFSVSVQTVVA